MCHRAGLIDAQRGYRSGAVLSLGLPENPIVLTPNLTSIRRTARKPRQEFVLGTIKNTLFVSHYFTSCQAILDLSNCNSSAIEAS